MRQCVRDCDLSAKGPHVTFSTIRAGIGDIEGCRKHVLGRSCYDWLYKMEHDC